jgi:hypothetical protein
MTEVPITPDDIAGLGRKLGRLEPDLTEPERTLLRLMLGLASDAIGSARASVWTRTPADGAPEPGVIVLAVAPESATAIRDQFASAFTPGAAGRGRHLPGSIGPAPA